MGGYANPLNTSPGSAYNMPGWSPFGTTASGGGGSNPFGGPISIQNQYGSMPGFANPGQAASPLTGPKMTATADAGGTTTSAPQSNPYAVPQQSSSFPGTLGQAGATNTGQAGIIATNPQYPLMSGDWAAYLLSQIGQGLPPFNLSTMLPTGGMTAPGQLTAPLNPMMQQLMQFFMGGGTSMPGMNSLATIANQGVSALPEWQSMVAAMQPNIQQNQAQIAEQFAGMGALAGSPFGTALADYQSQTALGQNALLAQLQQQNIGTQVGVGEYLQNAGQQFAGGLQGLDQNAINAMLQQYEYNLPQNNPMNQFMSAMATLYPPTTKTPTSAQEAQQWASIFAGPAAYAYSASQQ